MKNYLIALIFFLTALTNTSSQELSYQKYSVKDGLSQTQVMDSNSATKNKAREPLKIG